MWPSARASGLVSAVPVGGLVAVLLAHLRFCVSACDEQFAQTGTDLVELSFTELIVPQLDAFKALTGWRLANPNSHGRCLNSSHLSVSTTVFC